MTAQLRLARAMSEADLTAAVIGCARALGWRSMHMRPGLTQSGRWLTHVQGDGVGFPDLLLVRRERLVAAELKAHRGQLSGEQKRWLADLEQAGVETYVWRPSDWIGGEIEEKLR